MRYTFEIRLYQQHPLHAHAKELLQSILRREQPPRSLLFELFDEKADIMGSDIAYWLDLHGNEFDNLQIRRHNENAPEDIARARKSVEANPAYQKVQRNLLFGLLPSVDELEEFFAPYAQEVHTAFAYFEKYNLRRKCNIPSVAHLNRVGSAVYQLNFNKNAAEGYPAIGALHDVIEDLLGVAACSENRVFDLGRYREFLDFFIPEPLMNEVMILTNHYDLIISTATASMRRRGFNVDKPLLLTELKELQKKKLPVLHPYVEKLIQHVDENDFGGDFVENLRWHCYRRLYLKEIAELSRLQKNYRPMELKAIDLSDNGHGKESLAQNARIKNLIKQERWSRRGYELRAEWDSMNRRVEELGEDALVSAEHMVIKDFLSLESYQDFLVSSLYNIRRLKSIFFVKPHAAGQERQQGIQHAVAT